MIVDGWPFVGSCVVVVVVPVVVVVTAFAVVAEKCQFSIMFTVKTIMILTYEQKIIRF